MYVFEIPLIIPMDLAPVSKKNIANFLLIISSLWIKRLVNSWGMLQPECKNLWQRLEYVFISKWQWAKVIVDDKFWSFAAQTETLSASP